MSAVEELAERMSKDGFTVPGKDLSDEGICADILSVLKAVQEGKCRGLMFNDSRNPDRKLPICDECKLEIPLYTSYNYLVKDEVQIDYHHECYPNTELKEKENG